MMSDRGRGQARALLLVAACAVLGTLALLDFSISNSDFPSFYQSAQAFRFGQPLYASSGRLDMNPPLLAMLLSPLSVLSLTTAFAVWEVIGLLALGLSLRAIHRRGVPLSPWLIPGLVILLPCWYIWRQGQLTWVLVFLVTQAWSHHARSKLACGLWLAPAVAIKPPLALAVIWLGLPVTVTAAIGSLVLVAGSILVTGFQPWLDWLSLAGQVVWIGAATNASLWGLAARFQTGALSGAGMRDIRPAFLAVAVIVAAALARRVSKARDDRRWVLAFLWSVWLSPLGWIYYLPVALAPMLTVWKRSLPLAIAVALFCMPRQLLLSLAALGPLGALTAGSLCAVALAFTWRAFDVMPPNADQRVT